MSNVSLVRLWDFLKHPRSDISDTYAFFTPDFYNTSTLVRISLIMSAGAMSFSIELPPRHKPHQAYTRADHAIGLE